MVANVLRGGNKGVIDWVIQRISALLILSYIILLCLLIPHVSGFREWQHLFAPTWMKVFTLISLLSILMHSWVGMWTIFTDYISCSCVRLSLQFIVFISLIAYFIWGIVILWGV